MSRICTESHFINRELSWLDFNSRVLEEALDSANPLLERLKFTAIFSNNLDEFFMVRVAGLRQQLEAGSRGNDPSGLTAAEQLEQIHKRVRNLVRRQYRCLNEMLLPELENENIVLTKPAQLRMTEREELQAFFHSDVYPVLTPVAVDPSHPFPILANGALELAVKLRRASSRDDVHAFVEVPSSLSRFVRVKTSEGGRNRKVYILLEDLIMEHLDELFLDCTIRDAFPFRVTRDMDFTLDEESGADLMEHLESQLRRRRRRAPVRLEVPVGANWRVRHWLMEKLDLAAQAQFAVSGPLDLADCFELVGEGARAGLIEPEWPPLPVPGISRRNDIFDAIRTSNPVLLMHPFQTFDPVVRLLETAAEDPDVLAIKQTLYRVSGDSPVVRGLQKAAENGKQVTVIVELKARFDEERNIAWARRLEESGAHVIYGIAGLKIHSKALLVIRREEGVISRYVHMSTGNYNDRTARLYTDIGCFTTDPEICTDVAAMFNVITGYSNPPTWRKVSLAPFNLRENFLFLIDREARLSTPHNPGHIMAKMNSLVDPEIIEHLYRAAYAGVQVDLVVRGICCLRPGIGTDNIRVVSIVDRFLEHSRIYYFANGGNPEYYLASADWMPRNLDRRVELLFPVHDRAVRYKLRRLLEFELADRYKGRELRPNGRYTRPRKRSPASRSQRAIYDFLIEQNEKLSSGLFGAGAMPAPMSSQASAQGTGVGPAGSRE